MKLEWKQVFECHGNYEGQEVNVVGKGKNREYDLIHTVYEAEGPICECGEKMVLKKVTLQNPKSKEIEEITDIESFCDKCGIADVGFFTENEKNEIDDD